MNPEFWTRRWEQGRLGFHLEAVNPLLVQHLDAVTAGRPSRILVPMCGKSVDLPYLRDLGHEVVGVEVSPLAVSQLHAENDIQAETSAVAPFELWQSAGLRVYCGDVFALPATGEPAFHCVYDRAAVVAVDPQQRREYVDLLKGAVMPGGTVLLVCLEYDASRMAAPPYSVPRREVRELFGSECRFEELGAADALDDNPKFRERGLQWLTEYVWRITLPS